jgi:hypothetical protein
MHNRKSEPLWGYSSLNFVRALLRLFTFAF